jgi:hypothetical protein
MATTDVVLIPQDIPPADPFGFAEPNIDLDTHNNETGYTVVDLTDGNPLGVVGVIIPAEDGFDAVYGWMGPRGKSTTPFKNLQDATRDLLDHSEI